MLDTVCHHRNAAAVINAVIATVHTQQRLCAAVRMLYRLQPLPVKKRAPAQMQRSSLVAVEPSSLIRTQCASTCATPVVPNLEFASVVSAVNVVVHSLDGRGDCSARCCAVNNNVNSREHWITGAKVPHIEVSRIHERKLLRGRAKVP